MQPDYTRLHKEVGLEFPVIGFYDSPRPEPFAPFIEPKHCIFAHFDQWLKDKTTVISKEKFGCRGSGYYLCGEERGSEHDLIKFLVNDEGLKASPELIVRWNKYYGPYRQEHKYLLIGKLKEDQYDFLKTVTFFINPDQLSAFITGATYFSAPDDIQRVITSFCAGCMQLVTVFKKPDIPQAAIGSTDMAMRKYLPPDILAFTVTKPMFEQLCKLDGRSFLYISFWKSLKKAIKLIKT